MIMVYLILLLSVLHYLPWRSNSFLLSLEKKVHGFPLQLISPISEYAPCSVAGHLLQLPPPLCLHLQFITESYSKLLAYLLHCPSAQLQQAFPGNLPVKPATEASMPAKQVGQLWIFTLLPLLQIQCPIIIPSSIVDYLWWSLLTNSILRGISRS